MLRQGNFVILTFVTLGVSQYYTHLSSGRSRGALSAEFREACPGFPHAVLRGVLRRAEKKVPGTAVGCVCVCVHASVSQGPWPPVALLKEEAPSGSCGSLCFC